MTKQTTLLNAVVATGAGATELDVNGYGGVTFHIKAASVTTGATVAMETLNASGEWVEIDSRSITANGNTVISATGAFTQVRANITARTDGTYTVGAIAGSPLS